MNMGPMNGRHALLLVTAALVLAACQQETVREIDWAKAALSRNPNYEIVATDETAGIFTVRDTATGGVSTLKLKDLIAAPLPSRDAPKPATSASGQPVVESPDPAEETADDALTAGQTTEVVEAAPPGTGPALAEGPGYSITRATGDRPEPPQTTLEGPGYKIERQGSSSQAQGTDPASTDAPATANVVRRTDPIICQGDRLMRIDGEVLAFSGDAVIAEKGCDLYISNARISAGGVGIIARQARVHIVNSTIGGSRGAYEVSEGAEIYVARSTFTGIGRRFEGGSMTDLGGNSYSAH